MINDLQLVFTEARPDLSAPDYLTLLRGVPAREAWVKYSAALLGGAAVLGVTTLWVLLYAPAPVLQRLGLPALTGNLTAVGNIVLIAILSSGLWACYFSSKLFRDEAPYALSDKLLRRYVIHEGKITGFGPWISFGGHYNRYQRIFWTLDSPHPVSGRTPYVQLTLSVWLEPDDPVYIGLDPEQQGPPIFLGVGRTTPAVLKQPGEPGFAALYRALEAHFATSKRWEGKQLLKVWGIKRRNQAP